MRPLFNGAGAAGLFCLSIVASAVQAAEWNGSYSSDGACFCSGNLDGALARRMAPTPIGGQSIAQICERIGKGPGLTFNGSRFSQPVYLDAQCGNGPFAAGTRPISDSCAGAFDLTGKECVGIGPVWDLSTAYGAGKRASTPVLASDSKSARVRYVGGDSQSRTEETINRSSGSVYRKLADSASMPGKDVVAANTLVEADEPRLSAALEETAAPTNSDNSQSLPIIDLGGVPYQLAPAGIPRKGGAPGSRIILDGKLYLKYVEGQMPQAPVASSSESEPAKAAATEAQSTVQSVDSKAKAIADAKSLARQKATARANARKQAAAKKAKASRAKARLAKAAAAEKTRLAQTADTGRDTASNGEEAREAARMARTQQLLADARKRLQRRNARILAEAAAEAKAQSQAASPHGGTVASNGSALPSDSIEAKTGTLEPAPIVVVEREAPTPAKLDDEPALSSVDTKRAVDETSATVADNEGSSFVPTLVNAFRMPPETRTSSREFAYVDAMPVSYAYGGGGVAFEASATNNDRIRYMARLGVASEYQEVLIGASVVLTPSNANRMTLVGTVGFEAGQFALEAADVSTTYDDTGIHIGVSSRLVLNNKFELQGGVGYSSFFDGDVTATGGGYYHLNRQLDIVSRFELGDNDSLGIGVRYYY